MIANHPLIFCPLAGFGVGLALTPLFIRLARILGLVDLPGARKVHLEPVPRIGGLAIAVATLIPLAILFLTGAKIFGADVDGGTVITLIASSMCILIFGLIDDLAGIPAKYKLLVLLLVSCFLCGSGGVIRSFIFHGQPILHFGLASWPITVLWIIGVTVGINFIDGLDGLAAGIVATSCAVLAITACWGGFSALAIVPLTLLGALLSFLVFNFNPAKIFMGDCGSMFLGFILAGCCIVAQPRLGTTQGLILPALALSIPIFDTLFTLVRRGVLQRRSLFSAERGHIHHRLLDMGLCHRHVVLVLYSVTFLGAGVALVSLLRSPWATGLTGAVFCLGLVVLFRTAGSVRARETLSAIRRNRALSRESKRHRIAFEELQLGSHRATSFDSWWELLCHAAELLDFAKMDLPLEQRDGSSRLLRWRRSDSELAEASSITAEIPVPQRRAGQTLRISVEVAVNEFLENAGNRLALFSRLIADCSLKALGDDIRSERNSSTDPNEKMPDPQHAEIGPHDLTCLGGELSCVRVAIVHDFLYTYAGAERVLEQLIALFPDCDLFSLFDFLPPNQRAFIKHKPVHSTFIQRMPWARRKHRAYLPLMPLAIEQLDLSPYEIVISSSYLVAKGVLTRPDQLHICYCHTPVRYAWDLQNQYLRQVGGLLSGLKDAIARVLLHYIRNWDVHSANNVDVFVTNSEYVGRRIKKIYRRSAETIYPPVDTDWFSLQEQKEDFYLTASRLVQYKRIDLIVEAFNRMPSRRLFIVGEGPEMEKLQAKAAENIRIIGYQSAARLRHYLQRARAFVFAAEEDFGIVPVEAQACGTPVICYGRGGVIESVIDGKTGIHYHEQTPEAIIEAVARFEDQTWDYQEIRRNAERFSIRQFRERFTEATRTNWAAFQTRRRAQPNSSRPPADHVQQGQSSMVASAALPDLNLILKSNNEIV